MGEGIRHVPTALTRITAVLIGATVTAWTLSTGRKARLCKVMWSNRTPGNGFLSIGYTDNTPAFVQVLPDILMVAGHDGELGEDELPGFLWALDPIVAAGSTGNIELQSSAGGAAGVDVQIQIEVEEYGA